MQQIRCEACSQEVDAIHIVNVGSMERGYRRLCGKCFNTEMASRAAIAGFEHVVFEPIELIDATGDPHVFHFRAHLLGSIVTLDAFELDHEGPSGYQFQVIGEPEDDLFDLLAKLVAKMRRALAIKHVEDGQWGPQVTDARLVRGRVTSDLESDDQAPMVVIDGREVSWGEFGRMVMAFEGWQFKLEFRDISDEV
jgi:hypothetical protein